MLGWSAEEMLEVKTMSIRVPCALLWSAMSNLLTHIVLRHVSYLKEATKLRVVLGLVFEPLLSTREVTEICGVRHTKLSRRIKEYIADAVDHRCFFALTNKHDF